MPWVEGDGIEWTGLYDEHGRRLMRSKEAGFLRSEDFRKWQTKQRRT